MMIPFALMNPTPQTDSEPVMSMSQQNPFRIMNKDEDFNPKISTQPRYPIESTTHVNFTDFSKAAGPFSIPAPISQENYGNGMYTLHPPQKESTANTTHQTIQTTARDQVNYLAQANRTGGIGADVNRLGDTGSRFRQVPDSTIHTASIHTPLKAIQIDNVTEFAQNHDAIVRGPLNQCTTEGHAAFGVKEKMSGHFKRSHDENGSADEPNGAVQHLEKRQKIAEFGTNNIICTNSTSKLSRALKDQLKSQGTTDKHRKTESQSQKDQDNGQISDRSEKGHGIQFNSVDTTTHEQLDNAETTSMSSTNIDPGENQKAVTAFFRLHDKCFLILKKFLSSMENRLWNTPSKYREMNESDDPVIYQVSKKSSENKLPKVACVLTQLIPPVLQQKRFQKLKVMESFSTSHRDIICKLANLVQCNVSRWEGIYLLLPWVNMNFTRYCLDTEKSLHPSLNLIEAHRRVLKMEGACAKLVEFLSTTILIAQKHLRRMAPKHLADAYAVLTWESKRENLPLQCHPNASVSTQESETCRNSSTEQLAEYSAETITTREDEILKKAAMVISNANPSASTSASLFAERCKWLKENRRYAT